MTRIRRDVLRSLLLPLLVATLAATSIRAQVQFRQVGSGDPIDHLFRNVTDRGALARPFNGTVTETASQVRMAGDAAEGADARLASGSTTLWTMEPAEEPRIRAELFLPLTQATDRRAAGIGSVRELRRLREENRALRTLLTDLRGRTAAARGRHNVAVRATR